MILPILALLTALVALASAQEAVVAPPSDLQAMGRPDSIPESCRIDVGWFATAGKVFVSKNNKLLKSLVSALAVLALVPGAARSHAAQNPQKTIEFSKSSDEFERRDQPVTDEDLRILQRAADILSSPAVWNRHDTRVCHPEDKTWSLFCAMEKASLDVLGQYRHREVALQEVRFAVEDATKGIEFRHRMMDYNNLETTKFEDIKNVLKVATRRVSERLASQKRKK